MCSMTSKTEKFDSVSKSKRYMHQDSTLNGMIAFPQSHKIQPF